MDSGIMDDSIAIQVSHLSKRYRIGLKEQLPDTFVGAVTNFVKRPLQNLRDLRRLTRFREGEAELQNGKDVIWALKDLSFEIPHGEVVGIIGRNGAGKTTLLKVLSKITHPTAGRAVINGRVSSLLEVGTGFHPELTGRENIYLNGAILGMTRAEIDEKYEEILEFAGVEKFVDTPVKRYSKGMSVRLAFSVAAHLEPEILLVDEVLAVGDLEFQKKCLGKMEEVTRKGRTVLLVSHNMGSILDLCEKAIWIHDGRIAQMGEVNQVVQAYQDSFGTSLHKTDNQSNDVYFGSIQIGEQEKAVIETGKPMQVKTSLTINAPYSGFSLFFILNNARGDMIIHERVESSELDCVIEDKEFYSITLNVPPLWLNPGVFTFYFKILVNTEFQSTGRYFSEYIPITVVGRANPILATLNPDIDWKLS